MNDRPPNLPLQKVYFEMHSREIETFLQNLKVARCHYYASDLLVSTGAAPVKVEKIINHTAQILSSLQISSDDHIFPVYRGASDALFKDWKLSSLASVYMLFEGDPTDMNTIARQQNALLNYLLTLL